MDINTLRSISTVLVTVAFFGICWWAYSPKRKSRFEEAAKLPFADEDAPQDSFDLQDRHQDSGERQD